MFPKDLRLAEGFGEAETLVKDDRHMVYPKREQGNCSLIMVRVHVVQAHRTRRNPANGIAQLQRRATAKSIQSRPTPGAFSLKFGCSIYLVVLLSNKRSKSL
jgi:hypothetical protein